MSRLRTLWRNLLHRRRVEDDLDREIVSYQTLLEDEHTRAGAPPAEARRRALVDLGGREQIKEEVRDIQLGATLAAMAAEFRQSLRGLRRNPGLSFLAVCMLALGMGASTVVFSIFHTVLLRPLPFRDADRVVELWETRLDRGWTRASFTEANFWDVRSRSQVFEEVGAHHDGEANLTGSGPAERITRASVTPGFFRALGLAPILGRDFSYEEGGRGADSVLLLGYRFWRTRFAGDPNILGTTLRLDGRPYTVIGVLPPADPLLNDQTFVPFAFRPNADRDSFEFTVIARLKPGVPLDAVRADLQRAAGSIAEQYPSTKGIGFGFGLADNWRAADSTRLALKVLLGAVAFLLLIGCLNLANLLLARGMSRRREIAVRTALGAGRARLARFVLMESLVLSACGAALGLALAFGAIQVLNSLELRGLPELAGAALDARLLAFAVAVALVTGILSGLAPALNTPTGSVAGALREGDRQTGSRAQSSLRSILVTGEVALSFLLLVGAGLLVRSFSELLAAPRGFHTENRLVFSVSMPGPYYERGLGRQFVDNLLDRLSALPEVVAAGSVNSRPIEGWNPGMGIVPTSQPHRTGRDIPWAGWRVVTPGYFPAMGLQLLRGRFFQPGDPTVWKEPGQPEPQRRVILSDRLAKLLFPNEDPIGKRVFLWHGQSEGDAEVIGVVSDMRERGIAAGATLTVYLPYGNNAVTSHFVVHTRGNPLTAMPAVRSLVNSLDPDLPITDARSLEEVVYRSVAPQRFNTILLGIFSALALLLATTGIYGVLSYSMSRRTSEIGLRVALGASSRAILRMAVAQGMRPVLAGLMIGAVASVWLSRYVGTLLFNVKPLDAITYATVAALLTAAALAACYIPGRRAMRTDPAIALRIE